jgi:hypothetical protein
MSDDRNPTRGWHNSKWHKNHPETKSPDMQPKMERVSKTLENERYLKLSAFLWPIAGTLFGLLVVPLGIDQYPESFHENTWLLPASVLIVVACFVVPLFFHRRAWRAFLLMRSIPRMGLIFASLVTLVLAVGLYVGSVKMFRFHKSHLEKVLQRQSQAAMRPTPATPEQAATQEQSEPCDAAMHRLLAEYADQYPRERQGLLNGNLPPPTDWMNEKLKQQGSPCVTASYPITTDSQPPPLLKNDGAISGVTIDGGTVTNDGDIKDSNITLKDWFAYKLKKETSEKAVDAAIEERHSILEKQVANLKSPSERLQRMDEFEQAQLQLDAVKGDPEKLRSLVDTWKAKK